MAYITVPGFSQMTKQNIFDRAVRHIAKTQRKSVGYNGDCVYSGSGCNASILIREDKRKFADELDSGSAWDDLVHDDHVPDTNMEFVLSLQYAHDNAGVVNSGLNFLSGYKNRMKDVAIEWGLKTNILDYHFK